MHGNNAITQHFLPTLWILNSGVMVTFSVSLYYSTSSSSSQQFSSQNSQLTLTPKPRSTYFSWISFPANVFYPCNILTADLWSLFSSSVGVFWFYIFQERWPVPHGDTRMLDNITQVLHLSCSHRHLWDFLPMGSSVSQALYTVKCSCFREVL